MIEHSHRPFLFFAALIVAGCTSKTAADQNAEGKLSTEKDKISYVIGRQMAESLKTAKDEIDVAVLSRSITSTLNGDKSLLSEEEIEEVSLAFSTKMRAKRAEKEASSAKVNGEEGKAFLAENAKRPGVKTTASGLQYQILSEGKGPKPKDTDTVRVHYTGALLNGEVFDSSQQRGEAMAIALAEVVPGWREGLALMPAGSKFKLWLPAELAYGQRGTPGGPIGPNAALTFEVELLGILDPSEITASVPKVRPDSSTR